MPVMYCRRCDYPLEGLDSRVCPECGRGFDPADRLTFRPDWHWPEVEIFSTFLLRATYVPPVLFLLGLFLALRTGWNGALEVFGWLAVVIWCGCALMVIHMPIVLTLRRQAVPGWRLLKCVVVLALTVWMAIWVMGVVK